MNRADWKGIVAVATGAALMQAAAAEEGAPERAPATQRNFVTCPIVMDTVDVPCWVAEYEGERYYLTVQTGRGGGSDVYPFSPMIGHEMLVEGTVTDEPRICGGIVLRDVKLSPMQDVTPGCGRMIPGEGYRTKGSRPLIPDGDPPGDRVSTALPRPAPATSAEENAERYRASVEARAEREWVVPYFFDANYLPFPFEQRTVDEAAQYAADINASRVEIVGYRGATILSDGGRVVEKAGLAQARAQRVADMFEFFEFPRDKLAVSWNEEPEHSGGVRDYEKRRVTIRVLP